MSERYFGLYILGLKLTMH